MKARCRSKSKFKEQMQTAEIAVQKKQPKQKGNIKGKIKDHKPKRLFHLGDLFDFKAIRKGACAEERSHNLSADIKSGLS